MSLSHNIPFLDLVTPHENLREELCDVFKGALANAGFIGGPMVEEFETEFAEFCGARYCIGVGSGTDALRFALIAAGVKAGDIVITVPNTFIATTEAISQAGAQPAFVDIDERTYNLDPEKAREYLELECYFDEGTERTIDRATGRPVAAIVPVHLYGQPADMDAIAILAEEHKITVIEDASQAHGAEYYSTREARWKRVGSIGMAAAFSFYPGKNLGACGEAGAVTTNDAEVAQKIRMLRDHGQSQKYHHELEGYNGRLDAIQAGILQVKLKHLPEWTERRCAAAARYQKLLAAAGDQVAPPYEPSWAIAVYHLFVVRVQNRGELMKHLASVNIGTGIHYPIPLHLQRAYRHLGHRNGDFPVAEKAALELLSLPMFPGITIEQQMKVADEILSYVAPGVEALAIAV
jgi:dTDP-4-amino-4,6-dideoxygalactose transaminase